MSDLDNVLPERNWVSLSEAADYCGLNEKSIRRYISAGKLKAYRIGGKSIRINKSDLDVLFVSIEVTNE